VPHGRGSRPGRATSRATQADRETDAGAAPALAGAGACFQAARRCPVARSDGGSAVGRSAAAACVQVPGSGGGQREEGTHAKHTRAERIKNILG
jgi:hypothetical protein